MSLKERLIVKRDPNGVLSHANWEERDAANQAFNPFPGRRWKMPKMFESDYLNVRYFYVPLKITAYQSCPYKIDSFD